MKKTHLLKLEIGSAFLLAALTTGLFTGVFSAPAQAQSVSAAATPKLPVNKIIATINMGLGGTVGLAVTPDNNRLYTGTVGTSSVVPINVAVNPPVIGNSIATGSGGRVANIAITPNGQKLYALLAINPSYLEGSVSVIKNASSPNPAFLKTIQGLGEQPTGIAVNPSSTQVYITDYLSASINVITSKRNRLVPYQLQAGNNPLGIAFTPDGKYVYFANFGDNTVDVINTVTQLLVGSPIGVGANPESVAITPNGTKVYVVSTNGTVADIDTATRKVTKTINLNTANNYAYPGCAVTPNGNYLYVVTQIQNQVVMMDTQTDQVVGTAISTSDRPSYIAISPNGQRAYIIVADTILVVDITTT